MTTKNLYIISGCNGAGKTTASYTVLPEILDCREFVNADEIARGLSPFNPASVAIEAGQLMLQRIEDLLAKDETFSIETTLATRSYVNLVKRAQDTIKRRYAAGINNLFKLFMPIVDYWAIYDNSGIDRVKIASAKPNRPAVVYHAEVYEKINAYVR